MATMMAQERTMQDWKTIFPNFATLEGSCLFIKKLIAVSLSAITYIRGIFPEKAYGEKNLAGIKLKILNETCGLKSVAKFIDLVRSCYDAVEKKYLQQMSIGVVANPENREEVLELYNLVFDYKDDECSFSCNNEKNEFSPKRDDPVVQATLLMLKNVCAISDLLGTLPKNSYITIKLLYFDDVTPSTYEPMGFGPCHKASFDFVGETMKIQLGKINTENHSYKFFLKTTLGQNIMTQRENSILNSQSVNGDNVTNGEVPTDDKSSQRSRSGKAVSGTETQSLLQCPCKCKTGDHTNTILCMGCGKKQHKVCYAILELEDIPPVFYCVDCILDNTDGSSNQDIIYSCEGKDRQDLCLMRRALTLCSVLKNIGNTVLEKKLGCSKTVASTLIERLEFEGFIKKCGRSKYTVDTPNITNYGFENYFPSKDKENVETNDFLIHHSEGMEGIIDDNNVDERNYSSNYNTELHNEIDIIEDSINQVQSLSLSNTSRKAKKKLFSQESISNQGKTGSVSSGSQKRKLSKALLSPDNSEELFQSMSLRLKRSRTSEKH